MSGGATSGDRAQGCVSTALIDYTGGAAAVAASAAGPTAALGGGDLLIIVAPGRCFPQLVCSFKENDPVDGYLQYTTINGEN